MKSDELVSIVLPTYNRKSIIGRAISSVLEQTYRKFELLIVDDGSTDKTGAYLQSNFSDNRIKYHYQSNKGVSSARNKCLSNAQGRYIAFIDSDDKWDLTKIEKQMTFFKNHSEISLLFCDLSIVSQDGTVSGRNNFLAQNDKEIFNPKDIVSYPYLGLPTVMLTKELYNSIGGFDENLSSAEDVDLYLKASLKTNFGYLGEKLVTVYNTEGSLSSLPIAGNKIAAYENNILVMKRFFSENTKFCEEHSCDIKRAMFDLYCSYCRALLCVGAMAASREQISLAHKYKISLESIYLLMKTYIKRDN